MDLVPATRDPEPQHLHKPTALVPLATTLVRRGRQELPSVVFLLSSSTLIGLRVYLEAFTQALAVQNPSATTAATYLKRGRGFLAWLEQGRPPGMRRLDRMTFESYRAYLDQRGLRIHAPRTGIWWRSDNS